MKHENRDHWASLKSLETRCGRSSRAFKAAGVPGNVAALRVRGLDVVHADLATLGYDTRWSCLRASTIGAAHHRDRMFILAHRGTLPHLRQRQQ